MLIWGFILGRRQYVPVHQGTGDFTVPATAPPPPPPPPEFYVWRAVTTMWARVHLRRSGSISVDRDQQSKQIAVQGTVDVDSATARPVHSSSCPGRGARRNVTNTLGDSPTYIEEETACVGRIDSTQRIGVHHTRYQFCF